jgi:cysteine desulfuration protein SufE
MTTSQLPDSLARIVQRFKRYTNPKQGYELLITLAKRLPAFPEEQKLSENKVQGCVSQVYITAELKDGKVVYQGDSDSQLVKGLVALLVEGLSGLTPSEILKVTPDFIQETGLNVSLTPSRANGFYNIFKLMRERALTFELINSAEAKLSAGE